MRVEVERYLGSLPLWRSRLGAHEDVVRVIAQAGNRVQILQGMDTYWVHVPSQTLGMMNDPENRDWYEGDQAVAWRLTRDGHERLEVGVPPGGAIVMRGIMLPDSVAREVGLLGPDDHSPDRPSID